MNISVEKAINLIASTLHLHKGDLSLPYFFIVGAGISAPEIPLAPEIIELCKEEIRNRTPEYYDLCIEEMRQYEANPTKNYSGWIERAYPNSVDRSRFFKSIITEAKISSANLMLAHILYSKKIATTVFTTNFDDKLKQALELIGVTDLFVAENEMDNLVISPQNEDIQIVHVHGTYNFYDCANLEDEIQSVANQSNTISSSRVLANFLTRQAPIIVGYSGWENDVIMTCLKERLSYPTPLTYIWVCYSRESYDALPQWLKNSSSVSFVIPEISDMRCEDEVAGHQFADSESQTKRDKVDATTFLGLLISSIKLNVPEIFENPSSYYSKRIDKILPQHEDVLHLRHWAERMKYFGSAELPFEKLVKQLEHADVTNDLNSATSILSEIIKLELPISDVRFTSETLIRGLLKKKSVFETFEAKLKFRMAVLDYIESNYTKLLEEGILSSCLDDVFMWRLKKEDRDTYISLLDRIYAIAERDSSTLDIQLTTMGVKSSLVTEKQVQVSLLSKILELSSAHMDDPHISYVHYIASYDLAELSSEAEAVELLRSTDKLIQRDKRVRIHTKALKSKSKILRTLSNEDFQIEWMTEIIHSVEVNVGCFDPYDILEISSNIIHSTAGLQSKADKVLDFLLMVYDKCRDLEFSYCEHALWMVEICITLSDLSSDAAQRLSYFNDIMLLKNYIPLGCNGMKQLWQYALSAYCMNPVEVVPDQLKAKEIQRFKQTYPDEMGAVISILTTACQIGDAKVYETFENLGENVDYCKKINVVSSAYTQYTSKDFKHAEEQFLSLINCGYADLETTARNNLAFMMRRKETVRVQDSFWDIINDVSDDLIFKHMNTVLYCISENLTDDPRYKTALEFLRVMTHEDVVALYRCWSDINLVGESESELALKLIAENSKIELALLENEAI